MAKKSKRKGANAEPGQAEERIKAIKAEIAQAMIQRNTLPTSASDEEKAAATALVEQLQAQHHEAVQRVLAIKREETAKLEQEHKEKKLRHKRLAASRQPDGHAAPYEEPAAAPPRASVHRPMDSAAEEAQMDAANEADLFLERQRLEEEDGQSADELAHARRIADRKRKKDKAAERRDAKKRQEKEAQAKTEAAQLKADKQARAKIRQQAALQRTEESKAKKRQLSAERQARQQAARDVGSLGWFSTVLGRLKAFFRGPR